VGRIAFSYHPYLLSGEVASEPSANLVEGRGKGRVWFQHGRRKIFCVEGCTIIFVGPSNPTVVNLSTASM